jgi:hypothetical protein
MMYSFVPTFAAVAVASTISMNHLAVVEARLEVIGTGFGRTGTDSLKEALNILGYKTYDMKDEIGQRYNMLSDHLVKWNYLVEHDCNTPDAKEIFDEMFNNSHEYTAAIGVTAFCVEALLKHYPEAKFVHTERTSAELWHASTTATFCNTVPDTTFMNIAARFIPLFRNLKVFVLSIMRFQFVRNPDITEVSPQMCIDHKQEMIQSCKAHNAQVKKKVPRKKLLVMTINHKDGQWGPLCKFLGKPIPPDQPFPHSNSRDSDNFSRMVAEMITKQLSKYIPVIFILVSAVLAYRMYYQNNNNDDAAKKDNYKKTKKVS